MPPPKPFKPTIRRSHRSRRDGRPSDDVLIEHAHRCWLAECENAERISGRVKLLGGVTVALLGLGLFKVEWLYDPSQVSRLRFGWVTWTMRGCLVVAVGFFARALWVMFHRTYDPLKHRTTASQELGIRPDDIGKPIKNVVFDRTYGAFLELQDRNYRIWQRLQKGEWWTERGVGLVIAAIILYLLFSIPPVYNADGESTHEQQPAAQREQVHPANGERADQNQHH